MVQAFMREVDLTTRLRHPNIVQIFGVVTSDANYLKVVMDYAPDGSLRDFLDQNPTEPLSEMAQLNYIKQLCHGIEYLHGAKVAHRDLKSLNVLLYDDSWFLFTLLESSSSLSISSIPLYCTRLQLYACFIISAFARMCAGSKGRCSSATSVLASKLGLE